MRLRPQRIWENFCNRKTNQAVKKQEPPLHLADVGRSFFPIKHSNFSYSFLILFECGKNGV
jgi:hypothetical protein